VASLTTDQKAIPIRLHPRENRVATGTLGAINAEIITICDGCSSFALDLRGTFSLTVEISGTIDGTNWMPIPVLPVNQTSRIYVAAIAGTAAGVWEGKCAPYTQIRARVTAYTSGSATATLVASNGILDDSFRNMTSQLGTVTAAASATATLNIASPGAGLRHYLSFLRIERHASALLTAAATPTIIATTNVPGSLAFSIPVEAAAQGSVYEKTFDWAYPLAVAAQNTATTIIAPIATGVIWRMTAGWFVAP
jgi:hypothetical protein